MKKTIKKLPKSQVSIEVSLPAEVFESYREKALNHAGEHMEISGFRKGKAPKHIVEKNIKPEILLDEMAQNAISEHFSKILAEEKLDAIGRPQISITKIAPGNPLEFIAIVDVFPEVKLSDYKKIASGFNKNKKEITVSDEDLDKAIIELKKVQSHNQKKMDEDTGEEVNKDHIDKEENYDATLNDDDVKKFGPFENVNEFREKFRDNIRMEEEAREREKNRVAMLDSIIESMELEIPDILIESELQNLIGRLKTDISNAGLSFEDYLNHIKKTEEDIRKEFLPDAEKRAKMELVMYKIGETEKISPKEDEIEKEVKNLMDMYKGADENRTRAYVTHLLSNEAIFSFLESL